MYFGQFPDECRHSSIKDIHGSINTKKEVDMVDSHTRQN